MSNTALTMMIALVVTAVVHTFSGPAWGVVAGLFAILAGLLLTVRVG